MGFGSLFLEWVVSQFEKFTAFLEVRASARTFRFRLIGALAREASASGVKTPNWKTLFVGAEAPTSEIRSLFKLRHYPRVQGIVTPVPLEYARLNQDNGASVSNGLFVRSYPTVGVQVVPATYCAGKSGYVLLVLLPVFALWLAGPTNVAKSPWLPWGLGIYVLGVAFSASYLRSLKL